MPKRIDLAQRRRLIAEAAITVIEEHGLEGAGLRDVARAAKLTTGAITHYFEDKDAVLQAALEEVVRRTLEKLESGIAADGAPDPAAFLARVHRYLPIDDQGRGEWRVWLAFWARAVTVERLRALHRQYYSAFVEYTIGALQRLSTGKSPAELRVVADAVIAAVDGIGIRATLEPDLRPAERQRETIESLLRPLLSQFLDADKKPK